MPGSGPVVQKIANRKINNLFCLPRITEATFISLLFSTAITDAEWLTAEISVISV